MVHIIQITFLIAALKVVTSFTCQGTTYSNALSACPDLGTQKMSSGGNVTVFIRSANNLPNSDFTGPAAGVSDPYVRLTYGTNVRETKNIRNNLNPVWNEYINLGVLGSATGILVEIWDKDSGLEFSDDLLVQGVIRVPFCSALNANYSVVNCGQPFGCSSDDSLWQMPNRQLCHESGYFSFKNGQFCSTSGICLFLDFYIVPFTMEVELQYKNSIQTAPQLSVAGPPVTSGATWTKNNGLPYLDNTAIFLNMDSTSSSSMKGALMLRMNNAEKSYGTSNAVKFYGSINFPANVYICRYVTDDTSALGVPKWIQQDFQSSNTSVNRLVIAGTTNEFECYYNYFSGTIKNKWGGVMEGAIPFKTNTVAGYDNNASPTYYTYNYIILAIPYTIAPREDPFYAVYDMALFVGFLFSYGLIWFVFTVFIGNFLHKIDYRIDRVTHFIATRVLTGEDSSLLATLFIKYRETPCNIRFRAHLFHARNIILFILSIPFWLLISWGISCNIVVQPVGLGYAVMFIGLAVLTFTFGIKLWETSSWRFSAIAMTSIGISILFFLCFLLAVVFADPYVIQLGATINFAALSIVFGTINVIPLILLVFYRDRSQQRKLAVVMNKMIDAVYYFKRKDPKSKEKVKDNLNTNKLLHAILGETYTINPNIPVFQYSGILQEISPSALKNDTESEKEPKKKEADSELEVPNASLEDFKKNLYYASILSLLMYFIISAVRTPYISLAFLNILTLLLLDFIHICISRGDIGWSPGFMVALLVVGRLLIMSSPSSVWILNYSACYMIYALLLTNEMVDTYLPTLSAAQAGRMVFAGEDIYARTSLDIAGTPFFCLGFLTFAFAGILIVASLRGAGSSLPVMYLDVFGDTTNWPSIIFALTALLFTIVISLIFATTRAFYLERHGLLRGWAKEGYMYNKFIHVPMMLAICSEVSIVASGLIIYGVTKSVPVLISTIFFPLIFVSLGYAFQIWAKNEYELVIWPPKEDEAKADTKNASDLDVAFKMIEDLFGNENDMEVEDLETPETELEKEITIKASKKKTLKGFKLPPLKASENSEESEIKMPPLPLKSVLRRKRQNLGIKTKVPLIKDLKSRDGADIDKFGDDDDIIDIDDPWAEYENKGKVKRVANKVMVAEGTPFLQNPYVVMTLSCFSKTFKFLYISIGKCVTSMKKNTSKVYVIKSDEDIENGEVQVDNDENNDLKSVVFEKHDIRKLKFYDAAFGGHLTRGEYVTLFSWYGGLFLVFLYGLVLSFFITPSWIGFVVWYAISMFICSVVPMYKYFMTYAFDETMLQMIKFDIYVHFLFSLLFFLIDLNYDIGLVGSLWILDYFLYYPLVIYAVFETFRWFDNGCKYKALNKSLIGNSGYVFQILQYVQTFPFMLFTIIVLNWQFYVFIDNLTGQIFTLLILIGCIAYFYLRDWASNNFYLSSELIVLANIMINLTLLITFLIALFGTNVYDVIFAFSVFSFVYAFKSLTRVMVRIFLFHSNNRFVFFAPYIMPVYVYDTINQDLMDETSLVKDILRVVAAFVMWGCLLAIFYNPVDVGTSIACCSFLFLISLLSIGMSYVPEQLARCAPLLTLDGIVDVAGVAKEKFYFRKLPLDLEVEGDWEVALPEDPETEEKSKPSLVKQQERASLSLAVDIITDTRALKYVKEEKSVEDLKLPSVESEEDEYELPWYQKLWVSFRSSISRNIKKLFEYLPMNKKDGWIRHSESLFSFTDAFAESIITSRGCFGLFGCEGIWYKMSLYFKDTYRYKYLSPKFFDSYDKEGNNITTVMLSEGLDSRAILSKVMEYDKALDYTFKEEARCAIHFLLMMIMDSEAKLEREKVLFQRFLRENRFKLASNGISPPHEIFSSESYASTNIPLVAVWLSTLTADERERFHSLKAAYSEEQKIKDEKVDAADYNLFSESRSLELERLNRDHEQGELFDRYVYMKKEERIQEFSNTLLGLEKVRFQARKETWLADPNVYVDVKEIDLHNRFKIACMTERDEVKEFVHNTLTDIETGQRDTRLGEYGRTYQFVDSSFAPNDITIGNYEMNKLVLGWRCAPGVSDNVQLFDGGTHPDDIQEGIFNDTWLISALSMLVAAGNFGNGLVNELVQKLFVGHLSSDGEMTLHTDVGAYCIQIYRNGEFTPIIIDDLLPMRNKDYWTNDNRGMACAHNTECKGLWVALIEKAFAKYFGSYAALQKGFIHHALKDLTGFDTEWVPLAAASRGYGKETLWENLLRFKNNGYILGAGTGDLELVDKDIQDAGIVFNSEYTIYDVLAVEGVRLLRVRNPPGDHDEWKGDYSDKSFLWTKRLKGKISFSDADDNTFYISFDDFCNVFRNLYVCKYYNPSRWIEIVLTGIWKKADVTEIEKIDLMNQFMKEQDSNVVIDVESQNKRKAKARIDCAGGLPTRHNPSCVLENNPFYSLQIFRPTDLRIGVNQFDAKGNKSNFVVQPFSIFLVKNPQQHTPVRLEKLNKEDIVAFTGPPKKEKLQYLYVNSLSPGLYIVLVACYLAGMEGRFTISLLSNYKTEFNSVWPPVWILKGEKTGIPEDYKAPASITSADDNETASFVRSQLKSLFGAGEDFDVEDDEIPEDDVVKSV